MINEIVKRIYRKKTIDKYLKKNSYLNNSNDDQVYQFLYERLSLSILIFLLSFILLKNLFYVAFIIICFHFGYTYFKYDYKINKRINTLEKDGCLFFPILLLTLESGKNLIQAIKLTTDNMDNELSNIFKQGIKELEYGKSVKEVLININKNMPSDSINLILINIIDAYESGKEMITSLDKQIDYLENKRLMDIKKRINQMPIKISVVSVLLLIPLILLLILSPVILEYFV